MQEKPLFPGALDIPNEDYHADTSRISKSGISKILKAPAHYYAHYLDPARKPEKKTPALILGSAVHAATFEPDLFSKEYIAAPDDAPKRPTSAQLKAKRPAEDTIKAIDYWAKFDDLHKGKIILSAEDFEQTQRMADAVWNHSAGYELVSSGFSEQTFHFTDPETGVECKVRPDHINEGLNVIPDLKTTEDASANGFARSIIKYGYDIQDPFYLDGVRETTGISFDSMVFIAVENKAPYLVSCYILEDEDRRIGRERYQEALYTYREAKRMFEATGDPKAWAGYSDIVSPIRLFRFKAA